MTPVAMATKFGTKSAITRPVWETYPSSLRITGVFLGRAIEWFYHDQSLWSWQRIWDKIGCNSACVRDIQEISAYNREFRCRAIEWCQKNSTTTNPCCHGNEIWDKIGYNSACVRACEIFAYNSGFSGSGYRMMPCRRILPRPTFVDGNLRCHGNEI